MSFRAAISTRPFRFPLLNRRDELSFEERSNSKGFQLDKEKRKANSKIKSVSQRQHHYELVLNLEFFTAEANYGG